MSYPARAEGLVNSTTEYKNRVVKLLETDKKIIARSDMELGQTETVTTNIDTEHSLLKLKSYRTPLHKEVLMKKAI